jgi:hypothetical protein
MKKTNIMQVFKNKIFREQKLTIGLDLGDCWSSYCVLDEAGKIILEGASDGGESLRRKKPFLHFEEAYKRWKCLVR